MLFLILLIMTILGAFAGLFLKRASSCKIKEIIKNYNLYLGGSLYVVSALLNVYVLSKMEYSFVLPFTAMTYIWTLLISFLILKEKINIKKIVAVCCIMGGAVLVALG